MTVTPRKLAIQQLERGFHTLGNALNVPSRWVVAECWRHLPRPHRRRWWRDRRGAPVGGHPGGLELRRLRPRGDRLLSCLRLANLSPGIAKGSVAREVALMIRQSERRDPLSERLPGKPTALGGAGKEVVALIEPMKERRPLGIAGQVPEELAEGWIWSSPCAKRLPPTREFEQVSRLPLTRSRLAGDVVATHWRRSRDAVTTQAGRSLWTIAPVVQEGWFLTRLQTPPDGIRARAVHTVVTDGGANDNPSHPTDGKPGHKRRWSS